MTGGEFFRDLGIHYGRLEELDGKPVRKPRKYDEVVGKDVAGWLRTEFIPRYGQDGLPVLFKITTQMFSANYGRLPDKAQLVKAAEKMPQPIAAARVIPKITDEETEVVVAGLAEIMSNLKKRPWQTSKTVERRDPYRDDTMETATKPVEKGPTVDSSIEGGHISHQEQGSDGEGPGEADTQSEENLPGWV